MDTEQTTSTLTLTSYVTSSVVPSTAEGGSAIAISASYAPYTSAAPTEVYTEKTTTVSVVETTTLAVAVEITSVFTVVQTTTVRADAGTFSRAGVALMGVALGAALYAA
jgi:hypothetical protein